MIPFVPVTVSSITAATFCGPSYIRISSRCGAPVQTGHGSGCPAGQRYVYGSNIRTKPGSPGSANQRPGSPAAARGVPRRGDGAGGGAGVRRVADDHFVTPGHPAGEFDRFLVRLGPAVCEESVVQVAGHGLGDEPGELGALVVREAGCDRAQP